MSDLAAYALLYLALGVSYVLFLTVLVVTNERYSAHIAMVLRGFSTEYGNLMFIALAILLIWSIIGWPIELGLLFFTTKRRRIWLR